MTNRAFVGGVYLVAFCAALTGCSRTLPSYRYRLTVEVETPQGLRTGSSVFEVSGQETYAFAPPEATGVHSYADGEAVAVDLPSGQTLFALPRSEYQTDAAVAFAPMAYRALLIRKLGANPGSVDKIHELKRQTGAAVLPRYVKLAGSRPVNIYPMLVRFRDLRDPKSVEAVDPSDLAASFGRGTVLKRITVKITDDQVTRTLLSRLKWLPRLYNGGVLGGVTAKDSEIPEQHLGFTAFTTERPGE